MKKAVISLFLGLLILGLGGSTYYFYDQNKSAQKMLKDPTAASSEEIKKVTTMISKFMDLPTDEEPTLATVLDKEKLKDQPFFARAENGDKVIIFTKSGKAILFRPSTGRIVDIAPISLGENQGAVSIVVLNGTKTVGLAKTFSSSIKAKVTNLSVLAEDTAANTSYEKSVVVDLTGKKADLAKQMAELIGGVVSSLPSGEVVPDTNGKSVDLLVIVGANLKTEQVTPEVTPSATPSAN